MNKKIGLVAGELAVLFEKPVVTQLEIDVILSRHKIIEPEDEGVYNGGKY